MSDLTPNKTEQIETLIHGQAYELAIKYAGRDQFGHPEYSKVFSITREEIKDYIRSHYTLDNLPFTHSSPSREDGVYLIPIENGWEMYDQERGIRFEGIKVNSDDKAWSLIVDHILRTSGTGLKWE